MASHIITGENDSIRLRKMRKIDQEYLRLLKNLNKDGFNYKKDISPSDQIAWYQFMKTTKHNCMYIFEEKYKGRFWRLGVLGFRKKGNSIDLYNIMRGARKKFLTGRMMDGMRLLIKYLQDEYPDLPITAEVLIDNKAIYWYIKCGFLIVSTDSVHNHILYKEKP